MRRSFRRLGALALVWLAAGACGGSAPTQSERSATATALFGAAGALGDECAVDDDCEDGFCDRTVPGGYCTRPCSDATECGADGWCAFDFCFDRCDSQRDCRSAEFQCFEAAAEVGVCSFDVGAAEPSSANIGAPCRAGVECAAPEGLEAYCIPEVDYDGSPTGHGGGMCVALGCAHDADCGPGNRCVDAGMPYCVPACAASADCRPGYRCDPTVSGCTP